MLAPFLTPLFTILDEKDGYWQIKLDKELAVLCTFNTPWGWYHFNGLPFGIKSANKVFQQKNFERFGDIPGIHIIADNMLIVAATKEEHDTILKQVLERARLKRIKFNKDKIQFLVDSIMYMGHIVSKDGVKPDNDKVEAINRIPPPTDTEGLQKLLRTIQYLAQYIPCKSSLTAPQRTLLRNDVIWRRGPEHQETLDKLKQTITTAPVLRYFNPAEQLEIQADASKDGLGACLFQQNQPIAYASRALTQSERNYAQIGKEFLAIVFIVTKFHQYVYGTQVRVQLDHKPLEVIFTKPIGKAPAQLQRMLLQLQKHDIQILYTKGKDILMADMLSRATALTPPPDPDLFHSEKVIHGLTEMEPLGDQ
ncbi:hypothetical protein Y1Q_0013450 [Alligator mississippiensis]|uniref:ribonuclease H n=1 Tax=Alligator mississippiensis TaxID=8496 RepID=A0A151MSD0_ALLMI|nr:hypothetical protein Y1Q_0013450 [Alligator mississippiensis]